MTMSLKAYVPALARTLGMPAATIYERQRSLTRLDLLDPGAASGPGSGVRITSSAKEVALLSLQLHLSFCAHCKCNVLSRIAALYASMQGKLVLKCV
jgi:hypothetical protein